MLTFLPITSQHVTPLLPITTMTTAVAGGGDCGCCVGFYVIN
jgi:hypothetical protein